MLRRDMPPISTLSSRTTTRAVRSLTSRAGTISVNTAPATRERAVSPSSSAAAWA